MGIGSSINNYGFNSSTTADQVLDKIKPNLEGKNVLITGANTGIGKETARVLAKHGANLILGCRDVNAGNKAASEIITSTKNSNIEVLQLDLSSLQSVKEFADAVNFKKRPIHILILNAGVMACPLGYTKQSYELQWGTNHLGHFYLANLLLDRLREAAPSRVVIVSSYGHMFAAYPNMDEYSSGKSYDRYVGRLRAYGNSKLSNVMHAAEFNERYKSEGITAYSLHPGTIGDTDLKRHVVGDSYITSKLQAPLSLFMKNIPQGAATTVYCAVAPDLEQHSGKYFSNCGYEKTSSYNTPENAKLLWKYSEELIKKFETSK